MKPGPLDYIVAAGILLTSAVFLSACLYLLSRP